MFVTVTVVLGTDVFDSRKVSFFGKAAHLLSYQAHPRIHHDKYGPASLADVRWGDVNVTVVNWAAISRLGNERTARKREEADGTPKGKQKHLDEYQTAVRAYRQLAMELQGQGLNEDAARFAYRAQVLQRQTLWFRMTQQNLKQTDPLFQDILPPRITLGQRMQALGAWLFSWFLFLFAGYGYRMWHILVAYLLVILICAGAYFILGMYYEPHLSLLDSVLTSVTAFHGRVFSEPFLRPGEPQLWFTAFEAVAGLVIEGVFIAMLTQKFFGK